MYGLYIFVCALSKKKMKAYTYMYMYMYVDVYILFWLQCIRWSIHVQCSYMYM